MKRLLKNLFINLYKKTKVNKKSAVFISHPDFSDNVYPLYVELKNRGFKCLWIVYYKKNKKNKIISKTKTMLHKDTLLRQLIISRYKYIFYSHERPLTYSKKQQHIYILWHGSPFKMYRGGLINNTYDNFYFVPSSKGCLDIYKRNYPDLIDLNKSYPYRHFRTDYFVSGYGKDEKSKAKEYFKLDSYKEVILCSLTWIRNKEVAKETNNVLGLALTSEEFTNLNNVLRGENKLLIIKPHPGQKGCTLPNLSNIRLVFSDELVEKGIQFYALIAQCAKLITDYSSILFDYCLLDKPVGHIIHDWDYFTNNEKEKFVYDNPEEIMYGTKIYDLNDLIDFIKTNKANNDLLRIKINELYNEDSELKESSTIKFVKEVLHQ